MRLETQNRGAVEICGISADSRTIRPGYLLSLIHI